MEVLATELSEDRCEVGMPLLDRAVLFYKCAMHVILAYREAHPDWIFVRHEDLAADPIQPNARLGTYTNFVNLMDMAGIAVPTRARSDGKPGSVTLLADAALFEHESLAADAGQGSSAIAALIDAEAHQVGERSGQVKRARATRRELQASLGAMPVDTEEFVDRDLEMIEEFRKAEGDLTALRVEMLGLEARIVASRSTLPSLDPAKVNPKELEADLRSHEADIERYGLRDTSVAARTSGPSSISRWTAWKSPRLAASTMSVKPAAAICCAARSLRRPVRQ